MVDTPAGWYPDGTGSMRWWDGTAWSGDVETDPPEGDEPEPRRRSNAVWFVAAGLVAALIIGALVIEFRNPRSVVADCQSLASDAVGFSGVTGARPGLSQVLNPTVVRDETTTHPKPTGSERVLVYSCQGTGRYTDGQQLPTLLQLSVGASGVYYVSFSAL